MSREEVFQVGVHQHKVGTVRGAALVALRVTLQRERPSRLKGTFPTFKQTFQTHLWCDETKGKVVHEEFKRICKTLRKKDALM